MAKEITLVILCFLSFLCSSLETSKQHFKPYSQCWRLTQKWTGKKGIAILHKYVAGNTPLSNTRSSLQGKHLRGKVLGINSLWTFCCLKKIDGCLWPPRELMHTCVSSIWQTMKNAASEGSELEIRKDVAGGTHHAANLFSLVAAW